MRPPRSLPTSIAGSASNASEATSGLLKMIWAALNFCAAAFELCGWSLISSKPRPARPPSGAQAAKSETSAGKAPGRSGRRCAKSVCRRSVFRKPSFAAAQAAEAAATSAGGGTGIEPGTVSDPSASFSLCNASCMVTVTSSRQSWVPLPSGPRNPSRRSTCSTKCFREGVRFGKPSRLYKNATSMTMGASIRKEAKSLFNVCPTTTVCGVINTNMSFWASSRVYSVASKLAAVMPVMCVR
mmetsp:Transcript_30002/g.75801  ORF Transcript_30002/g.75801 Transcript_30002/m.75801 type:complete len:241 (-) Transcript_30002:409-1131(-)